MGYVRIKILLNGGRTRSGIRSFSEPMNLEQIRAQALHLASETLGRDSIEDVTVEEVPASNPAVVALILRSRARSREIPASDGTHPYLKQQQRRPPR